MQTTYRQPGAPITEPTVWIDDGGPDQDTPRHAMSKGHNYPAGKLADVELRWTAGTLEGLKLAGFALWEARTARNADGSPRVNVTFPARQYTVNGERRSFALLREVTPATGTADAWTGPAGKLRALILEAWEQHQEAGQPTSGPNRPARFAPAYQPPTPPPSPLAQAAATILSTPSLTPADGGALIASALRQTAQAIDLDDPAQAPQPPARQGSSPSRGESPITALDVLGVDPASLRPSPLDATVGGPLWKPAQAPAPQPIAQMPAPAQAPTAQAPAPAAVAVRERCNRCGQDVTPADLQDHDLGGVYVRACAPCRAQLAQPIPTRTPARTPAQRRAARF